MRMRRLVFILLLLPMLCMAQDDDPLGHRGVQYAATGTDFWVCFPRTMAGFRPNFSRLYVVSERSCVVTVRNEGIDYTRTVEIQGRRMCHPDTNYIQIPIQYSRIDDTVPFVYNWKFNVNPPTGTRDPRHDYRGVPGDHPQPRGFHVTSTDTISLYVVVASDNRSAAMVLPTEMLRDEYIIQPPISNHRINTASFNLPLFTVNVSSFDIVAVDDSVTVDVVLSDWDWLNRRQGDTVTFMLRRGQLYHFGAGEPQEKYYPLLAPYYRESPFMAESPLAVPVNVQRHTFAGDTVSRDTFAVDLAGTIVKARDCKRIAVFESSGIGGSGIRGRVNASFFLEQSVPIFYAGKEYLVPSRNGSYIRMTALEEGATVTISDPSHLAYGTRTLSIPPGKTDWWECVDGEGPYYITSDNPILLKWVGRDLCTMTPTRWWHGGDVNNATINDVDENHNYYALASSLHLFTRNEYVQSLWMDDYQLAQYFHPLDGTPYSYAYLAPESRFNTQGTHHIRSVGSHPFFALMQTAGNIVLQHLQPGGKWLTVNDIPSDSLKEDSIWCLYDPVTFKAWNERPCDSLIWDFGDGTVLGFSYDDPGFTQPQVHTWQDTGRYTVRAIFKYEDEGCITRKSDTLTAPLWFHNHYDSLIAVHLCEGSYSFREHEMEHSGTYYYTTYWTESGCDTLWQIDLVTCPHCHWEYDTVAPDDLPVVFNGITFGAEYHDEPVYLHIGDSCDSIIYYTLVVIPNWGEKPIDGIWIIAPNVITPGQEPNNRFSLHCSPHILKAEVTVLDRRGVRMAQFDGLTGSWDGTSDGRACPQGTYVYHVRYIDMEDKGWKTVTGTVTLLR